MVPDLGLWQPDVQVGGSGRRARVAWSGLGGLMHGPRVTYAVGTASTGSPAGDVQQLGDPVRGTAASLDLRPYEEWPTELALVAATKAEVGGEQVTAAGS